MNWWCEDCMAYHDPMQCAAPSARIAYRRLMMITGPDRVRCRDGRLIFCGTPLDSARERATLSQDG